jgi:hypothetical protein
MNLKFPRGQFTFLSTIVLSLLVLCVLGTPVPVEAESGAPEQPLPENADNEACMSCHEKPGMKMTLPNGDVLPITVEQVAYNESVHGSMSCQVCHTDIDGFPHPERDVESERDYATLYHDSCKNCHSNQYEKVAHSVHEELFTAGVENTPTCADCHSPHQQTPICSSKEGRCYEDVIWIPNVCGSCHQDVYDTYEDSIHGEGLIQGKNPDMPTCIDCHSVHDICDPCQGEFRRDSIEMCANCHTDPNIMDKYGKSVNVMNTYVVFHDTTVTMLEEDGMTNKPTCYDCHGVHNVHNMNNPPDMIEDLPGPDLYPLVETDPEPLPAANSAVTGVVVGLIVGGAGTMTVSQLIKERKKDEEEER